MLKTGTSQTISYLETKRPIFMTFGIMDQEEILRTSVVEIKNERIYDQGYMIPSMNGVNDPRMGSVDKDRICFTCKGNNVDCPGHFGHIELSKPMYHIGFIEDIRKIMRCVCFNCSKVLAPRDKDQRDSISRVRGGKTRFFLVQQKCEKASKICDLNSGGCGMRQPKLSKKGLGIEVEYQIDGKNDQCTSFMESLGFQSADKKQTVWPEDVLRVFNSISDEDQILLGVKKPSNMLMRRLLVAPPPVRPSVSMGGGGLKCEDDLTYAYQMILKANNYMALQISKGANITTINDLRRNLQFYIATLMDNQIPGQPTQRHKSGKPLKAITQRLKGKEGRVRGNLMGKRVDFSARTVITPDPNLELDQLGVPLTIALNMTLPVTVTPLNIDEMRQYVMNGPSKYPGAKYIIRHDEKQIDLGMLTNRSDAHIEYGYIVERHLINGDYVVFNRQPSLHKMSTMGHRVRVLPYLTFRLNLSVTAPYNADFDGDEMNMFVPQGFESMAEVKEIMSVPNQIVSPQANKPVMGIVQDSLLGIMLFTRRDNFIDKPTVMNLMMWLGSDMHEKQIPIPAILKPKPLWTGKQILSLVIPNVNMIKNLDGPAKNPHLQWCSPTDSVVIVNKGELISGYVNKATAGSSQQGLIHIIWRDCGPQPAKNFLTRAQNVINQWLAVHGFTVGVQDAIASKKTMKSIVDKLNFYREKVRKTIKTAERGKLQFQPGKNLLESLEFEVNNDLNRARDEAGQLAFKDLDPWNKIQNMVGAGSKGTNINISQIMGCVGQQNVEGKRIPFGFNGRTLPHFTKYDYGPESKGFVKNNYLCGLQPSEFFFHAMGGREGIIDTAVKTSETGYIQRRLVKALEDVMVRYDGTVRNSSQQIIQFLYGEDGMAAENIEDVRIDLLKLNNQDLEAKYNFMPGKQFGPGQTKEHLRKCLDDAVVDDIMENPSQQMQILNEFKQFMLDRDELRVNILKNNEETIHMPVNLNRMIMNCGREFSIKQNQPTNLSPCYVIDQVNKLVKDLTVYPGRGANAGAQFFNEANENSTLLFKIYLRSELSSKRIIQQERMTQDAFDWLIGEIKSRFEASLIHPGEMVGSIAAHSLGEPATQMTLNTFHFAGVSSKNVTLGVPRLKEVINVAKNLKTPMVSIFLDSFIKKSETSVMKVQGDIEHTTLGDLTDSTQIYYDPDPNKSVVKEDEMLIALYNEVPISSGQNMQFQSPWLLRMKLDPKKVLSRMIDMEFINKKLCATFQDQIQVMSSDSNDENLVLRLRFKDLVDEYVSLEDRENDMDATESAMNFLREIEDSLLNDLTLKGIPEITKVYAKKYIEHEYDQETGNQITTNDSWMLETDGVSLQKILNVENVDYKKTMSNDINEILKVLGVEAVRLSLINELRVVLNFYGIYVNYRHLSTLCDVMCQRGKLTSITRHGINRLDSGPLRKCSFEETVDIFLEAACYGETDHLTGVTESIMIGQTAPLGTGCFELGIDPEVLQMYAQPTIEEGYVTGNTPIIDEHYDARGALGYMTDYVSRTPDYFRAGQTSEYGRTPGGQSMYDAGFSPGYHMQSPSYASPNPYPQSPNSPNYKASPLYGGGQGFGNRYQSPIYQAYTSPIYQPNNDCLVSPGGKQSPAVNNLSGHHVQSPNYSPNVTSQPNSPYHGENRMAYSPSYIGGGLRSLRVQHSPARSPSLVGNSPASPTYSPPAASIAGSQHRSNANSPSYSPTSARFGTGRGTHSSPNYSPTSSSYHPATSLTGGGGGAGYQVKQNYSPSYSPTTTPQFKQSPKYAINSRISPKYSLSGGSSSDQHVYNPSSIGSPRSVGPAGSASQHEAGGNSSYGGDDAKSASGLYIPSLPRYNPSSGGSPGYGRSGGSSSDYHPIGTGLADASASSKSIYDPTDPNNKKISKDEDHE